MSDFIINSQRCLWNLQVLKTCSTLFAFFKEPEQTPTFREKKQEQLISRFQVLDLTGIPRFKPPVYHYQSVYALISEERQQSSQQGSEPQTEVFARWLLLCAGMSPWSRSKRTGRLAQLRSTSNKQLEEKFGNCWVECTAKLPELDAMKFSYDCLGNTAWVT